MVATKLTGTGARRIRPLSVRVKLSAIVAVLAVWIVEVNVSSVGTVNSAAGPPPAAQASTAMRSVWPITPSPNHLGRVANILSDVSCSSAAFCKVLGYAASGPNVRTLIQSWNGTALSMDASPNPSGNAPSSHLYGVSCTSPSSCIAVGEYSASNPSKTLVESWNGTAWSIVPSPNNGSGGSVLQDVSCLSASSCTAVGNYDNTTGGANQTLIESWNGTSWSIVVSPNIGTSDNELLGVSCSSTSACMATGRYQSSATGPFQTLTEAWNGTSWAVIASPNNGASANQLSGVTCTTSSACTAVGQYVAGVERTLIESWDGTSWSIVSSPNSGTTANQLSDVSCLSTTACTAVGDNETGTLVESWNGTSWAIVGTPNVKSSTNSLSGVACISSAFCIAGGKYSNASTPPQTLVESWNGTSWSIVRSPTKLGVVDNILEGVSCTGSTTCMAVGYYNTEGTGAYHAIVESRSGGAWSLMSEPNGAPTVGRLNGVSCAAANACTAVGSSQHGIGAKFQTLVESWNGAVWAIVPSPNIATSTNELYGVSCVSATACLAVGYSSNAVQQTLVESWNGTAWSIVPSPNRGAGANVLRGIACTAAAACTAVGDYFDGGVSVLQTLIERWDGTSWSLVSSPNVGTGANQLFGVSCLSSGACTAAGRSALATLIESWDGTSWSTMSSPNASTGLNELTGLSCLSASACTSVGYFIDSGAKRTLVEAWDGTMWSIESSPSPGVGDDSLSAVGCVTPSACTAVGSYANASDVQQTLIEASLATGPAIDWPTYGGSVRRTGENANETVLNPNTLSSLSQKWTYKLDSVVTTPPVVAAGVSTAAGPQDLVFVGDEHGNFVALNEHTGALVWQRNLGSASTSCTLTSLDNIVGITAAAVIDRSTNRIYEVGGSGLLYGLDLSTGAIIAGWPVTLTTSPARETDWGALTLNGGSLYAVLGGTCDKGVYHGRLIQVDTSTPQILHTFWVTPSGGQSGGAIWGWGGSAIDVTTGDVYVATGNSFGAPENSFYSEAVVKLDSALSLIAYDQPTFTCCKPDLDFGSAPVLFQVPGCPAQLAIQNKDGELMLYNRDSIASGPVQRIEVLSSAVTMDFIGQPAWSDALQRLFITVPVDSNLKHGMAAFTESSPSCILTQSWNTRNGVGGTVNSPPTVAGNVVYESNGRGGLVYAFNAITGAVLWNSGPAFAGGVWSAPTVVNGMLFVVSWDHKIHAFGF